MSSIGVTLLWLLSVYAKEGKYINDRNYDELFEDKIRKAINASNSLEETVALSAGQMMAAYPPTERPTIQQCWKSAFFGIWKLWSNGHWIITWLSRAKRGLIVDERESPGKMRLAEQFPHIRMGTCR